VSQYYYLAASLPTLRFESPPPMSLPDYLSLCREFVGPADLRAIAAARFVEFEDAIQRLPAADSESVLARWYRWEITLRNVLAKLRALKMGWDPHPYHHEIREYLGLEALAQEALGASDPWEAEKLLMRARWSFLDELEVGHFFDTERLVVYSLKLQLLAVQTSMTREKGGAELRRVRETMREEIHAGDGYE
jgi:hypothetical protein